MRVPIRPDQAEAGRFAKFAERGSGDTRGLIIISFSSFGVKGELFESFKARID